MDRVGKIIFYEDVNFKGRYYECTADCTELNTHFNYCNSVRVESGAWVLFEKPNYLGYQYILTRGEYPNYQSWMGYNDAIRSCRIVRNTTGLFRVRVYERPDFSGQMLECTEDVNNLPERWQLRDVHSANILDGAWVFHELPNFRGRQYLLERGEYRRFNEWAAMSPAVGSFRRVHEF
ncbi:gamma-crystallin M2-like [Sphaeramia orbicularis]|uniref:Gamma-crystallin M2-like n=1 Tax=Sphaeramia orbicularis TaxID=375764 RepID=A0A673BDX4_9TELE|nr:gamma-crystallin M2-like [Sphaeramia orbicularis]